MESLSSSHHPSASVVTIYETDTYRIRYPTSVEELLCYPAYDEGGIPPKSIFDQMVDAQMEDISVVVFGIDKGLVVELTQPNLQGFIESDCLLLVEDKATKLVVASFQLNRMLSSGATIMSAEVSKRMLNESNIKAFQGITQDYIPRQARENAPLLFGMEMALLNSVAVFHPFRGKGISNVIYQACDEMLIFGGLRKSQPDFEGDLHPISSLHVMCSAPETIHLCKKYGYEMYSKFIYEERKTIIEGYGQVADYREVAWGLENEIVKSRFREVPCIEYYAKEAPNY
ncbi:hypothetical protein FGO68_gene9478 [Halteria grandinella]|uniref:Uncharacterized protein n=1 Tax=Halteria grandinella TaxID=5974 RepID=A0A8J8SZ71_HALGN|nr:hypothetical protein FGO68_gene9478 [Halteria grandinella]